MDAEKCLGKSFTVLVRRSESTLHTLKDLKEISHAKLTFGQRKPQCVDQVVATKLDELAIATSSFMDHFERQRVLSMYYP